MHSRAELLIRRLGLTPHPEGGHFREVFRSARTVSDAPGAPVRAALTTIYFLLAKGQWSRWHRLAHDELWHFYEGDPLELIWLPPDLSRAERHVLAPAGEGGEAVIGVPASCWQAARTRGEYTLAGCTMGPGFDVQDFELLSQRPDEAAAVNARFPEFSDLI